MSAPDTIQNRRLAIDVLDQTIVNLFATINASTYQALVLIREFDERAGWLRWGFEDCSQWLHWRCDLSPNAAREKVRVAHALKALPEVSTAFANGTLSYSKVRALVRVATPVNEQTLVAYALEHTAARVEQRCQQLRNALPDSIEAVNRAFERRSVSVFRNGERGTLTLTVELPMETGELVCEALDKAVEVSGEVGPEFESVSWSAQRADAMVTMAKSYLTGETSGAGTSMADTYQVVVHVDEAALRGVEGRSDLALESVKRMTCDGSIVPMVDGPRGEPLDVGRKQRTIPTALKRALWARDKGCSFPGCTHTRFVDAHHVRHWSDGGETNLDNTMLLCSAHHRLVHEGGYEIVKDLQQRWYFRRSDDRAIPAHGYHPDDTTDIGLHDTSAHSAEWALNEVREPAPARYA